MRKEVEFGRCLKKEDELREIEWIVLDEDSDGNALLLCKDCIALMQYEYRENRNKDPKWENCVVRLWLNNYFLNNWFTVREKEKMLPIPVKTPDGAQLNDKVILLNAEEVERFLPEEKDRRAKPTPFAKKISAEKPYTKNGFCTWFLRDPSELFDENYTGVDVDGKIDLVGGDFYLSGSHGIRPVIKVNLSNL